LFGDAQAIEWFDLKDVVRAPARLDWAKLAHVNNHYIREADVARLQGLVSEVLARRDEAFPDDLDARLTAVIPLVRDGAKTIVELADLTRFALKTRPVALDEKIMAMLTDEVRGRMARLSETLETSMDWTPDALTATLRAFAASEGVGLGKIGPWLRAVLSGGAPAPDLAGALAALGKMESLGRLEDALSHVR